MITLVVFATCTLVEFILTNSTYSRTSHPIVTRPHLCDVISVLVECQGHQVSVVSTGAEDRKS